MTDKIQFGVHFMLDGYGCPESLLKDKEKLGKMLKDIPYNMGMHIINEPVVVEVGPKNRKDPGGVSGFVMIAESHISFHTFPQRGFVTIDVYTCQNDLDTGALLEMFKDTFQITDCDSHVIERGTRYPSENIY